MRDVGRIVAVGVVWASLASALGACADDEHGGEDPAEHACEHRAEAGTAVTATADRASAPTIAIGDEPYTVTPSSSEPTYLKVAVTGDTPALLFAGIANAMSGLYEGDTEVTLPVPSPNELCGAEIPEHFEIDLHAAGDWFVELSPSATPGVWLMLTAATGHAHETLVLEPVRPASR